MEVVFFSRVFTLVLYNLVRCTLANDLHNKTRFDNGSGLVGSVFDVCAFLSFRSGSKVI